MNQHSAPTIKQFVFPSKPLGKVKKSLILLESKVKYPAALVKVKLNKSWLFCVFFFLLKQNLYYYYDKKTIHKVKFVKLPEGLKLRVKLLIFNPSFLISTKCLLGKLILGSKEFISTPDDVLFNP